MVRGGRSAGILFGRMPRCKHYDDQAPQYVRDICSSYLPVPLFFFYGFIAQSELCFIPPPLRCHHLKESHAIQNLARAGDSVISFILKDEERSVIYRRKAQ